MFVPKPPSFSSTDNVGIWDRPTDEKKWKFHEPTFWLRLLFSVVWPIRTTVYKQTKQRARHMTSQRKLSANIWQHQKSFISHSITHRTHVGLFVSLFNLRQQVQDRSAMEKIKRRWRKKLFSCFSVVCEWKNESPPGRNFPRCWSLWLKVEAMLMF